VTRDVARRFAIFLAAVLPGCALEAFFGWRQISPPYLSLVENAMLAPALAFSGTVALSIEEKRAAAIAAFAVAFGATAIAYLQYFYAGGVIVGWLEAGTPLASGYGSAWTVLAWWRDKPAEFFTLYAAHAAPFAVLVIARRRTWRLPAQIGAVVAVAGIFTLASYALARYSMPVRPGRQLLPFDPLWALRFVGPAMLRAVLLPVAARK
jgi:hypothetical protein